MNYSSQATRYKSHRVWLRTDTGDCSFRVSVAIRNEKYGLVLPGGSGGDDLWLLPCEYDNVFFIGEEDRFVAVSLKGRQGLYELKPGDDAPLLRQCFPARFDRIAGCSRTDDVFLAFQGCRVAFYNARSGQLSRRYDRITESSAGYLITIENKVTTLYDCLNCRDVYSGSEVYISYEADSTMGSVFSLVSSPESGEPPFHYRLMFYDNDEIRCRFTPFADCIEFTTWSGVFSHMLVETVMTTGSTIEYYTTGQLGKILEECAHETTDT